MSWIFVIFGNESRGVTGILAYSPRIFILSYFLFFPLSWMVTGPEMAASSQDPSLHA
jgi:hypothetical protein